MDFLLSRIKFGGKDQFRWALKHSGAGTAVMRRELVACVNALFAAPRVEPQPLIEDEIKRFEKVTALAVRLRGGVERDRRSREVEAIYGAEGPGRIGLALERLLAGLDTLGLDRRIALDVVKSVALDSVPPLRRNIYRYLCEPIAPSIQLPPAGPPLPTRSTTDIAKAVRLPSSTVRRGRRSDQLRARKPPFTGTRRCEPVAGRHTPVKMRIGIYGTITSTIQWLSVSRHPPATLPAIVPRAERRPWENSKRILRLHK